MIMTHEFEAGAFISALLESRLSTAREDYIKVNNVELNSIAYRIEKQHPSIKICLDRYSMETFRRQFPSLIVVERERIIVSHIHSDLFKILLQNNLPSPEFKNLFASI